MLGARVFGPNVPIYNWMRKEKELEWIQKINIEKIRGSKVLGQPLRRELILNQQAADQ